MVVTKFSDKEEESQDAYPELWALLREQCKSWSWANDNLDMDDRIEGMLDKTSWGLLREFEEVLVSLKACKKALKYPYDSGAIADSKPRNITALRCPFNANIGCMNGSAGVLEEFHTDDDVWGTTFRESGIMCAAWDSNRCGCTRLGKFSPGPQHAWSGYEGPKKN
jgi:hypothetical protein